MEIILWLFCAVVGYAVLYLVIRAAVRDAIIDARGNTDDNPENDEDGISKVICPDCGKRHDIDYPKCPFCNHQYQ